MRGLLTATPVPAGGQVAIRRDSLAWNSRGFQSRQHGPLGRIGASRSLLQSSSFSNYQHTQTASFWLVARACSNGEEDATSGTSSGDGGSTSVSEDPCRTSIWDEHLAAKQEEAFEGSLIKV